MNTTIYPDRTYEVAHDYFMMKQRASTYYEERLVSRLFPSGNSFVIQRNKYPYAGKFSHWLLWINPKYSKTVDCDQIKRVARFCFQTPIYTMFENPDHLRSVKSIRHFHVFTEENATLRYSTYSLLPG